ncbi:MAG: anti-sigma factor, partial [Piscinibacter sp.]|uniref:anti-sigma factor n=1 Tax=Piscinibacter sp. TaxID=1903157 RepID=UPI003D139202
MDYSRPELADRLAAAYVAGTLRGPARHRFETLLPAHPALRAAVRAWQDRLMPLTAGVTPVSPPPQVWQRIEARLGGPAAAAPANLPWWARLAFWRGLAALASVATIGLAVLLATPDPVQPPIVVVLNATAPGGEGGVIPASFVASISGDGRAVVTKPLMNVALGQDRVLELWAAAGKNPPRSLGLISAQGATVVRRAQLPTGTDHLDRKST